MFANVVDFASIVFSSLLLILYYVIKWSVVCCRSVKKPLVALDVFFLYLLKDFHF